MWLTILFPPKRNNKIFQRFRWQKHCGILPVHVKISPNQATRKRSNKRAWSATASARHGSPTRLIRYSRFMLPPNCVVRLVCKEKVRWLIWSSLSTIYVCILLASWQYYSCRVLPIVVLASVQTTGKECLAGACLAGVRCTHSVSTCVVTLLPLSGYLYTQ